MNHGLAGELGQIAVEVDVVGLLLEVVGDVQNVYCQLQMDSRSKSSIGLFGFQSANQSWSTPA